VLPRPDEDFLKQGTSDSAPSPGGFDPHAPDPSGLVLPIKKAISRADHVVIFIGEEHHVTSGSSDGAGEIFPVREGPCRNVCERFAEGIRRLLQRAQAKLTVEAYLV
jgi:hypothetical protein